MNQDNIAFKSIIWVCIFAMFAAYPAQLVNAQTYVYSPGYGLSSSSKSGLETYLGSISSAPNPFSDKEVKIANQTRSFSPRVRGKTDVILFGQSQGGIRARAWLQQQATSTERNAVKGFATISSPNTGGPILSTGVSKLRREARIAWKFSSWVPGANAFALAGLESGIRSIEQSYFGGRADGVKDMRVGSTLLNSLNRPPTTSCYTKKYYVTKRFGWFRYKVARYYRVCKKLPMAARDTIPSTTAVMSIVTANNSVDGFFAAATNNRFDGTTRVAAASAFTIASVAFFAAGIWPWSWWKLGVAVSLAGVAQFLWRIPSIYRNIVGSRDHDGLFPEKNQVIPRAAGGRNHTTVRMEKAYHELEFDPNFPGALSKYADETAQYLERLAVSAGVK